MKRVYNRRKGNWLINQEYHRQSGSNSKKKATQAKMIHVAVIGAAITDKSDDDVDCN